ncbi:MAG: acyltransferase family protein [Janthinobacterium lividum]
MLLLRVRATTHFKVPRQANELSGAVARSLGDAAVVKWSFVTPSQSKPFLQHSANLDLMRAFAVTCVLVHHLALTLHAHLGLLPLWTLDHFRALGHAGVLMFFVHTSMVLMESLDRLEASEARPTLVFYIRRLFRIYPLAIVAILIALMFHVPSKTWDIPDPVTPRIIATNLLLIQNLIGKKQILGPLWSLPYEVQMYVVLPLLHWVALRRAGLRNLLLLYGLFCAVGFEMLRYTEHLNMFAYIPCFLCGVLCYRLSRQWQQRFSGVVWLPFLLLAIAAFIVPIRFGEEPRTWAGWLFCMCLALVIPAVRDVRLRWLQVAGQKVAQYSFGVYLFHPVALWLAFVCLPLGSVLLRLLLFVLLTTIFSVAGYHLVELPFIQIGKRFRFTPGGSLRLQNSPGRA